MRLAATLLLLLAFSPPGRACLVEREVSASERADWPFPVTLELEAMPGLGDRASALHVTVKRNEAALADAVYGEVVKVAVHRYKADARPTHDEPMLTSDISREKGQVSVIVPRDEVGQLRIVVTCRDTPRFRPCSGGTLYFRIPQAGN